MRIKNILLLTIDSDNINSSGIPLEIDTARGNYPPLGLLYLASELLKVGYTTKILDLASFKRSQEQLILFIRKFKPQIIGMQLYSTSIRNAINTAQVIKAKFPSILIIVGGPHSDAYPKETISLPCFDIGILGEGSKRLVNVLRAIKTKTPFNKIEGIVFKHNGKINVNKEINKHHDLNKSPFSARQTLEDKNYCSIFEDKFTSIVASRVCYYSCTFCSESTPFRIRTPENVLEEIEHCIAIDNINHFYFLDSTFPSNDNLWIKRFCDKIMVKKLDISWSVRTRPDFLNNELLVLMKKAGCKRLQLGVESANYGSLAFLNKKLDMNLAEKGISDAKKNGFIVLSYFIIGFPEERREDVINTIRYARKLRADYAHFSLLTPIPNTKLYDYAKRNNLIKSDYWLNYMLGMTNEQVPTVSRYLTRNELNKLLSYAYRNFYFSPIVIISKCFEIINHEKPISSFIKSIHGLKSLLRIES